MKKVKESKARRNSWIVRRRSGIHSWGIFARRFIPKGTGIIEYLGEMITKAEASRRADIPLNRHRSNNSYGAVYIFELNKRYDIDGNVRYNKARYINHSCDPNCDAYNISGHIWIEALRDILPGEEITYNYGYSFDDYHEHPCLCRSNRCVGFILDKKHWQRLKKKMAGG